MAHETVIRSSLLVRDVQNPNATAQKFAVFTGSGSNSLNTLGFRTANELLSDLGFNEAVDDRVASLLQAGSNIAISYDDNANTLTISAPNLVTGSGTATRVAFWSANTTLSSSSNLFWDNAASELGVNTATPSASIHVIGADSNSTAFTARFANSTGTHSLTVRNDGRVGIGTDSPSQVLHVVGAMRLTASTGTGTTLMGRNASGDVSAITAGSGLGLNNNVLSFTGSTGISGTGTANKVTYWDSTSSVAADTDLHWDATNNRLGVGTATPNQTVEIAGTLRLTGSTGTGTTLMARDANGDVSAITAGSGLNLNNNVLISTGVTGTGAGTRLAYWTSTTVLGSDSDLYWDPSQNRLGINETNAQANLHVTGTMRLTSSAGTPSALMGRNASGDVGAVTAGTGLSLVSGTLTVTGGTIDHGGLTGLADDDHTQYLLLAGRVGGQSIYGGTQASNNLTISSTSNATKGEVQLAWDGGDVSVGGAATASRLVLYGPNASFLTSFKAGTLSADVNYVLPTAQGTSGQALINDGSGNLSWSTIGGVSGTGTANKIAYWNGTSSIAADTDLHWDATNNRLGIGTSSPQNTLHIAGTMRLTGSTGTGTTLMARNTNGEVSAVTVSTGLSLSNNVLTSTGIVNPMTASGDTIYGGTSGTPTRLAGNITTTKQFLSQTGNGTVAGDPSWSTVTKSDVGLSNVENTALSTWTGSTSITTLGTIATGTWNASTIAVNRGGTGAVTLTGVVIGDGTNALTGVAGTASQLLRRNPANTAYEFFTHDFVNQAGARSAISLTVTGNSGAATYSSATGVLNVPTYTLAGLGGVAGTIAAGQVAYGTASNTVGGNNNLFWDNAAVELGIGTNAPARTLHVAGTMRLTGSTGTGTTLMARDASGDVSAVTVSTGLSLSNNVLTSTGLVNPMTTLGDIIYGAASGVATRLAGNITATKQFLSQTGNGSASAIPSWSTVTKTDVGLSNVENTALSTWAGSTSITTLGTIATGTWNASTIAVNRGGTGAVTLTGVVIGDGTNALTGVAGTASQLLRRNPANTGYEFFTHDFVNQAGARSAISLTVTGNSGAATYSSATGVLNVPTYTLAGLGGVAGTGVANKLAYWNGTSSIAADTDLHWDATNHRLGVGTATPNQTVEIAGTLRLTGSTGTGTTLMARNAAGDVSAITVGLGLSLLSNNSIIANFINPMTAYGDLIYGGLGAFPVRLSGNTTTTKQFLSQTGDGTTAGDPSWSTITKSDVGLANVENTALSTWAGSTNITTLGTVTSGTWSASTIAVDKGGTGAVTLTGVVIGNGTSALTGVAGTASQLLRRNPANTGYEFFTHDFVNQAGARSAISLTVTGSSGAATYSSATGILNVPTYTLAGLGGVGGTIAAGQVAYGTASNTVGGNNNLFWDNTNVELGIGTNAPARTLHVAGTMRLTGSTGTGTTLMARDASGDVSAVTVSTGLSLSNNVLTSTGLVNPMTTLGDTIYGAASGVATRLAGNITTTKQFLSQTGNGSASAIPSWSTVTKTDVGLSNVENTALSTWAGSTSITTLGTIATGTWNASTIAVNRGGTGAVTLTGVVIGDGTNALTGVAGTASQLFRRNPANTGYEFFTHDFVNQAGARSAISLTVTGNSGAATYSSATGVLNIPTYTLAGLGGVAGTIAAGQVAYGTASNTVGGNNNLFWDNTNVELGIGTNAPARTLHVAGTMRLTGSTGTGTTLMARDANGDVSAITVSTGLSLSNNVLTTTGTSGVSGTGTANKIAYWDGTSSIAADTDLHWDATNNRLGIGTSGPETNLHVQGTLRVTDSTGTASAILGRDGAGNVSNITTGTGLSLSSGTLSVTGSTGFSNPMTTLGDIIYGAASGVATRLAGNITATKQFLSQTGNGSASAIPSWSTVTKTDVGLSNVENTALSTWAGSTSITTLGTIATGTWNASTIAVNRGGTGAVTLTGVVIGDGTNALTGVAGTASQLLRRNPANTGYEFFTHDFVNQAGARSAISLTVTGNSGAATYSSATGVLNVPTYTLAGLGGVAGTIAAGQVAYGTASNTVGGNNNLFWDNAAVELGIGTNAPARTLHVAGTMRLTGSTGTGTTLMARDASGDVSAVTVGTGLSLNNNTITATISPKAETPTGTINGTNTVFTLASTPIANQSVMVFLNGVAQYNGIDYTVSGTTVTFTSAPATSSSIFAYYLA